MARVLIIRTSSFGDVAMLVPVVFSVASRYPQDRFTVMTRKSFSPLFENLNFNVNVLPFDPKKRHKGIFGLFRIGKRIAAIGFTHVADEHDVLRSKILRTFMKLTGCKVAHIDKGRKEKAKLITEKNISTPLKHTTQRYLEVFEKLGFSAEITFNNFFDFIPRDFTKLKSLITEKKGKWIAIAPFAKHAGKVYPLEKMEKVIDMLSADENLTIFLLGAGKEEKKVFSYWKGKYPHVIDTSSKLNLETELLLISYMDVVVSMDSANMHLASLVQVPVISIWGATHPSMGFYGFKQDINNAIQVDLECRPCSVYGDLPCKRGDYACMASVSETTVVKKIYEILDKKTS